MLNIPREILYYLAPDVELQNPYFRFGTYKSILFPEIKTLLDSTDHFIVSIILSESVFKKAESENLIDDRINYFVAKENLIHDDARWYHKTYSKQDCLDIKNFLHDLLGEKYLPDLILSYEKPSQFLRDTFPHAIVLDVMFGAFSRAPYPTLASYDPNGLFGNSFLAKHVNKIRSFLPTEEEKNLLKEIRRKTAYTLAQFQPYKRRIAEIRQKFSSVVLVACQVDDYYAVTETSNYSKQFDMVKEICLSLPSEIGIIVTQHAYAEVINKKQRSELEKNHPNLIIFDNYKNIQDVSQFLVPYMDALITVSSSLAFQAALWRVPVIAMGRSHVNIISSAENLTDAEALIKNGLDERIVEEIDNALIFILMRYNILYRSEIFREGNYVRFLLNFMHSLRDDPSGEKYFFNREIDFEYLRKELLEAFTQYKLRDAFSALKENPEIDYLLMELAKYKVASFDLFDTILQRPIIEPHELFLIMEPSVQKFLNNKNFSFHRFRREAEVDVRRPTKGEYEIILEDIYRKLSENSGISYEQAFHIMEMEKNYEMQFCSVKPKMYIYYKFAKLLCDKVIIISDFYIEHDFVDSLIAKNKIKPDILYVSATTKTRKHNGSIFPSIKKELAKFGFSQRDILHIGDNKIADKEMPERSGIKSYLFPKAVENLKRSMFGKIFNVIFRNTGLASSIVFGLFANRFYGTSWNQIDNHSMFRGDPYLLGYIGYGPLVVGFCQWLHREAQIRGYEKLYFLARDGYIIKTVYEMLYGQSNNNVYLYASRRATTVASLRTYDDIIELAHQSFNAQPLFDFLLNRFGIQLEDSDQKFLAKVGWRKDSIISPYGDMKKLGEILYLLSDKILANANNEREIYMQYLEKVGYVDGVKSGKAALIDIGYSGTMQYYLMRLLPTTKVAGLYILTHQHARHVFHDVEIYGYLSSMDDHRIPYRHKLNDHVFIFEAGLSSNEGSLLRFKYDQDGDIKPEFLFAEAEEGRKKTLTQIHLGVKGFAADYKNNMLENVDVIAISPILAEKVLVAFAECPSRTDAFIFYGNEVENLFGGGSVCLIEPCDNLNDVNSMQQEMREELIRRSKWKQGAKAIYHLTNTEKNLEVSFDSIKNNNNNNTNMVIKQAVNKQIKNKKIAKLVNNPYLFFKDSKKTMLRPVRFLFGDGTIGQINIHVLKYLVKKIAKSQ